MDQRSQVREFLTSRRGRITPGRPGWSPTAPAASPVCAAPKSPSSPVGVEYYSRLERGDLSGVSHQVLDSLARAPRLNDGDRTHWEDLARAAGPGPRRRRTPSPAGVRPTVQRLLDAMRDVPAHVMNGRSDVLAVNALGRALYAPMLEAAGDTVALLQAHAGRDASASR